MNINSKIKLNYNDITIVPEILTKVKTRSECNPYDNDGFLPIFASCMGSVVSKENTKLFNEAKIRTIIPRTYSYKERLDILYEDKTNFVAFSLNEINTLFNEDRLNLYLLMDGLKEEETLKICIDLANGHMSSLLKTVENIKGIYGEKVTIMTGNIANPKTYKEYEKVGVDYVRVSIGSGDACITSSLTGIHYPIFSLLKEMYEIKQEINGKCKIVADGGIRDYRDIQKALIYADYVMIGSVFNKAIESAGKTIYGKHYWVCGNVKILNPFKTLLYYNRTVNPKDYNKVLKKIKEGKVEIFKEYYGMASKRAQKLINENNGLNNKLKTSEGKVKYNKVEFSINGWVENETDALRSAMSYTNSKTLEDYKNSEWVVILTPSYNK